MAYTSGTATNYLDVIFQLRNFVCGHATHTVPTYSGTGGGTLGYDLGNYTANIVSTHAASVTETWTITVTDATVVGAEIWSVIGSVTGALPSATTGVAYTSAHLDFKIVSSGDNFVNTDAFSVVFTRGEMSTNGQAWEQVFADPWHTSTDENYILLKGKGNSGTEELWVSLRAYADPALDFFNLIVSCMTGYSASPRNFFNLVETVVPLWNSSIPLWINCNARRFILTTKVNIFYTGCYAGLFLPYGSPSEYPYPMVLLGNSSDRGKKYSDTSGTGFSNVYSQTFKPIGGVSYVRSPYNTWVKIGSIAAHNTHLISGDDFASMYPICNSGMLSTPFKDNLDGTRLLIPHILTSRHVASNSYGELDGVGCVSGFGSISSEDTITIDGNSYRAFQGLNQNGWSDFWVVRLN